MKDIRQNIKAFRPSSGGLNNPQSIRTSYYRAPNDFLLHYIFQTVRAFP